MPEQNVNVIVWALQTVPDLAAAARLLGADGNLVENVRTALGPGIPNYPLHKIVCIGALVASRQQLGWRIDAMGAPDIAERSEADLIRAFIEKIGELRPQLVTFNGRSFDLPVLRCRAMVNRVSAPGLQVRSYFHRDTENALELCDLFGCYASGAKVRLDEISKIMGLPGNSLETDGLRVEEMVQLGQINEVAQYCENDVLRTYRLWLIYELFRGAITAQQLNFSEAQLRDFVSARRSENPHLLSTAGAMSLTDVDVGGPSDALSLTWEPGVVEDQN